MYYLILLWAIHKCQHFHECTNRTLSETPFPQKSTHQHLPKNPNENNKNQAKKLKVYGIVFDFHRPPHSPQKCMVFTFMKMLTLWMAPYNVDFMTLVILKDKYSNKHIFISYMLA